MEKYTGTDNWELLIENTDAQCSFQKGLIDGEECYRVEQNGMIEDFHNYNEAKKDFENKVKINSLK